MVPKVDETRHSDKQHEAVGAGESQARRRTPHVPELPFVTWALLTALGWVLILVGVAGLVLPGIQGFLTLVFGGAVLSLTSHTILHGLRWCFQRWPKGWRRLLGVRARILKWLLKGHEHDA